jgi:hypothetical protein
MVPELTDAPPRPQAGDLRYWMSRGGPPRRCYPDLYDLNLIDPVHLHFLRMKCRDHHEVAEFVLIYANSDSNRPMPERSGQTLRWEFVDPHRMVPHTLARSSSRAIVRKSAVRC